MFVKLMSVINLILLAVIGLSLPNWAHSQDFKSGEVFVDCEDCPEMVVLPPGEFFLGSPESEKWRGKNESRRDGKLSRITVPQAFAMGRYETTVSQYARFVKATGHQSDLLCISGNVNGSYVRETANWQNPGFSQTPEDPVTCVSYGDARAYINWLSKISGETYQIPTQAEWEYAARAGTATAFPNGNEWSCSTGNTVDYTFLRATEVFSDRLKRPCSDGYLNTAPVGNFTANNFGLYDMHGNVSEWVYECYDRANLPSSNATYRIPLECKYRMFRGGSWGEGSSKARSARRDVVSTKGGDRGMSPTSRLGFRVSRVIKPPPILSKVSDFPADAPADLQTDRTDCEKGRLEACLPLAKAYLDGHGVKRNLMEAARLFEKSCVRVGQSCYYLAMMYDQGIGVSKSYGQAALHFRKACGRSQWDACGRLAEYYHTGTGVTPNVAEAIVLYTKGCDHNVTRSCGELGLFHFKGLGVNQNLKKGLRLLTLACDDNNVQYCASLGVATANGTGVSRNFPEAVRLLTIACEGKSAYGCENLGYLYLNGHGVKQDQTKAARLLEFACDNGQATSCSTLTRIKVTGEGQTRALEDNLHLY